MHVVLFHYLGVLSDSQGTRSMEFGQGRKYTGINRYSWQEPKIMTALFTARIKHGVRPKLAVRSLISQVKAHSKIPSASCSIRFQCTISQLRGLNQKLIS
jgi:hypothetical protein